MFEYRAQCLRVVDGDTFDFCIDLGMNVFVVERVRLYGVDTPETYGVKKDSDEFKKGQAAREFAQMCLFPEWDPGRIELRTYKDRKGKYGRYLADVYIDGKSLADALVEAGHAKRVEY